MSEQVIANKCDDQYTRVINIGVFSSISGEALTSAVRNVRRLYLRPELVLSHSDFERLLDYWPRFYLTGPVPVIEAHTIWSKLRWLFTRKKKVSPSLLIRFSNEALNSIRGQMLRLQAIPVDGVWVPVSIMEDDNG